MHTYTRKFLSRVIYFVFASLECGEINHKQARYLIHHPRVARRWIHDDLGFWI